jgi:ribosomal protein L14
MELIHHYQARQIENVAHMYCTVIKTAVFVGNTKQEALSRAVSVAKTPQTQRRDSNSTQDNNNNIIIHKCAATS